MYADSRRLKKSEKFEAFTSEVGRIYLESLKEWTSSPVYGLVRVDVCLRIKNIEPLFF
jgi:hypothetical protein